MTLPLTPRRGETSAGGDQRPQAVARIPGQASLTPPAGGSHHGLCTWKGGPTSLLNSWDNQLWAASCLSVLSRISQGVPRPGLPASEAHNQSLPRVSCLGQTAHLHLIKPCRRWSCLHRSQG